MNQDRRKYFTQKELPHVADMDEMLRMDEQIQEFGDRVMRGDKEAAAQIKDVMNT